MWSMLLKHNKTRWQLPPVFPLQGFIQWHHIQNQGDLQIHRHMETICPIHHQTMTRQRRHQPHTFMIQFKTRPDRPLMTKSYANDFQIYACRLFVCLKKKSWLGIRTYISIITLKFLFAKTSKTLSFKKILIILCIDFMADFKNCPVFCIFNDYISVIKDSS